ncbi:MAG TPA: PQQ-binding-like beta-propeller repeat protein [Candidatus Thermoplasmatota archaeon]|nr:PQQ-binding-like beta-propeller repeat protein [Candidatus Thermoplasmatota archaeon]
MACHDTKHTSLSPYNTSNMPAVIKWRLNLGTGMVNGGITIDNNGILYFGSWDNYVYAVYPNGTIKWRYKVGAWVDSTPAIASDGTIYVGCWDCYLYAFSPNGALKWRHHCGDSIIHSSPVIAEDGTIYIGTMIDVVALSSNGTEKWRYVGQNIYSSPVLALDGTIIFGSWDNNIYALNPNGTLRWRYLTGDHVMGPASIAADGTVYMASWDGYLYALNPLNGSLIWRVAIKYGSESNPAIGPDGTIYVGESYYYAINPNGTIRWSFDIGGSVHWSSPAVSHDGIIYIGHYIGDGTQGGYILALNSNGTERWRMKIADEREDSSPAIGPDGTVYIGCYNLEDANYIYAFGLGPIIVDANGPYHGYCGYSLKLWGAAFGGTPPYIYHWDFGDGTSSDNENPTTHNYSVIGNYTATFTVTDSEGNTSSDTAQVTVTYVPPSVTITKPGKGLYFMNTKILPILDCIIIGRITIEADAHEEPLGIARVEFLIDGKLKASDTEAPYSWTWRSLSFSEHTITVEAYDTSGKSAQASITVWKFF